MTSRRLVRAFLAEEMADNRSPVEVEMLNLVSHEKATVERDGRVASSVAKGAEDGSRTEFNSISVKLGQDEPKASASESVNEKDATCFGGLLVCEPSPALSSFA